MRKPIETYKKFEVFYYESPPEQYIAYKGKNPKQRSIVIRGNTLEEVKKQIDTL
jgi:hypothetical protein